MAGRIRQPKAWEASLTGSATSIPCRLPGLRVASRFDLGADLLHRALDGLPRGELRFPAETGEFLDGIFVVRNVPNPAGLSARVANAGIGSRGFHNRFGDEA